MSTQKVLFLLTCFGLASLNYFQVGRMMEADTIPKMSPDPVEMLPTVEDATIPPLAANIVQVEKKKMNRTKHDDLESSYYDDVAISPLATTQVEKKKLNSTKQDDLEDDDDDDAAISPLATVKVNERNLNRTKQIQIENKNQLYNHPKKTFTHFLVHIPKTGGVYTVNLLAKLSFFQHTKQRPCNEAEGALKSFQKHFHNDYKRTQCNMWMSEQQIVLGDTPYKYAYTITRKPSEHVISQYFHCKESKDHAWARDLLPPLDEWLDHHVERFDTAMEKKMKYPRRDKSFRCYDPINHQSYFTLFNEETTDEQLRDRFEVLGNMDMMGKSICAIFIRYSGYVPPMCDCSGVDDEDDRRRLHDHGVEHHGATFELTEEQEAKIKKITQLDTLLYEKAQRIFQDQVEEIEEELNIKLCDNPDLTNLEKYRKKRK